MAEHRLDEEQAGGALARWKQTEPLRLWLYGVAVPLVALLMGYGLVTGQLAGLWLAVATAALLGGGTEAARQHVVAPATAAAAIKQTARAVDKYGNGGGQVTRNMLIHYRIPT